MERLNLILAAVGGGNATLEKALGEFSSKTIGILNIVLGAITGLAAMLVLGFIVFLIVKKNNPDPAVAEQAEKNLKKVIISFVLAIVVLSVGFALINTVLKDMATKVQEEVTAQLLNNFKDCISSIENVVCKATQFGV